MSAPSRRNRRSPAAGSPIESAPPERARDATGGRIDPRPLLLAGAATAFVAQPLLASESAADGDGLLLVVLWLLLLVGAGFFAAVHRPPRRLLWVDGFAALLVGWTTLSAIVALAAGPPYRPTIDMAWEWLAFGASYATIRLLGPNAREARAFGAVMIAVATVAAAYGLYQYFVDLPATRAAFLAAPDQQAFLQQSGLTIEKGTPAWDAYVRRLNSVEPFSTFALANSLAGLLVPWLAVLVGVTLAFPRDLGPRGRLARVGATLALLAIAACLVFTKSRTGWIAGFAGVGLVVAVFRPRNAGWSPSRKVLVAGGLATLAIAGIAAWRGGLDWQVLTEAGKSLSYRFQYWEGASGIIAERPLFGCGVGRFGDEYPRFKGETASEEVQDPHNLLVEVWATAGTPAALALVAIAGWIVAQGFRFATTVEAPTITAAPLALDASPPRDAAASIATGGAVGLLVGWLGRLSIYSPLDLVYLALALPVAAGVWLSLRPWVDRGEPVGGWWIAALVAWGLNLTIAGGIGYPGVAGSGWLLLALVASLVERARRAPVFPPALGWTIAGVAAASLAFCHFTAYQPVNLARTAVAATLGSDRPPASELIAILERAAADDPWDHEWPQQLASVWLAAQLEAPSPERLAEHERWAAEFLERRGECSSSWSQIADWRRRWWKKSGREADGRKALAAQREVVSWYPHSPLNWAELATLEDELGEREAARSSAREALRLDAATPHADKKLSPELKARVERIADERSG